MTVRLETLMTIHTTDQLSVLPYFVLQKIMMSCGQWCKSCLFKLSSSATQNKPSDNDSDSDLSNSDSDDKDDNTLHPVKLFIVLVSKHHCFC